MAAPDRFNPPPNWPAPPAGWTPPEGWEPDPSWGPAPDGWQLWTPAEATPAPYGLVSPAAEPSTPEPPAPPVAMTTGTRPRRKGSKGALIFAAVCAVLLIVIIAAVAAGGGGKKKPASSALPLTSDNSSSSSSSSSSEVTPEPYTPKPTDFKIAVKIRSKHCFGSAGCNVSYRIAVTYSGAAYEGAYDVTYRVTGDESGPQIDTFNIDQDGTITYNEGDASTKSTHTILRAKATAVDASS